jgi:Flp pilus assembly protein protease CpaA
VKKITYLIGLVSSIGTTMGIVFKLLHWTGANELITFGFLSFLLIFLPLLVVPKLKSSNSMASVLGLLSAVITGLSILFKLLHLSGGDVLLLAGAALFCFGFLPVLFFNLYKKSVS